MSRRPATKPGDVAPATPPESAASRPRGTSRGPLKVVRSRQRRERTAAEDHPARWDRSRVRTIAIASGKGGVGKSNLAANLAVALGQRGARVLLLDADLAQANLDLLLGLHPRFDLQHVLAGEKTLDEILVERPPGVRLIPACSGLPGLAELDDYRRECLLRGLGQLDGEADLIIMDLASGVSRQVTAFCLAADEVMVVTTPEMPAFSDAYGLIKLLQQRGLPHPPQLVVNMAGSLEEAEETAHRIRLVARRFLRIEIEQWSSIPFDPSIARAVRLQEPVVTAFPKSPAAVAYGELAERLWEPSPPDEAAPVDPQVTKLEA